MNSKQYLNNCSQNLPQQYNPLHYPLTSSSSSSTQLSPTSGIFNDLYPATATQNSATFYQKHINSNNKVPPQQQDQSYNMYPDFPNWDGIKLPEKIDFVDINGKELSPTNYCCTNVDMVTPSENSFSGQYNNQWYNNNGYSFGQKSNSDYPACAQANNNITNKTVSSQYCAVQKNSTTADMYKSCAYYNTESIYIQQNNEKHCDILPNTYNTYNTFYDSKYSIEMTYDSNNCFNQNLIPTTQKSMEIVSQNIDLSTELSNDESDIVVEDFSTDCSDVELEKKTYQHQQKATKCLICSTVYTPLGVEFYILTSENPLTMSSQIPVVRKLREIIKKNIADKKYFLCSNCLRLVNTIDNLQMNLDNYCKDLMRKFETSWTMENDMHENITKSKKGLKFLKYRCRLCKRTICIKTIIRNHLRRHKLKNCLCELCGRVVPTLKKLKFHLKAHSKKEKAKVIESFVCSNSICDKTFRTKSNLKEHENFCLGLLPFICKVNNCNKKFPSSSKLKNHVKLKHEKKFIAICSICNIGFVKLSDYKSHMISHSTEKKFTCTKCGKSYKTLSNLNFHLKSHQTNLPFICQICQKGFMRKEYLEAHINNHQGIKNYTCQICEKKFVSQKNLDSHLKYHDGTVKSNICNICNKTVTSGFEEHLRVHANLKEFECDLCEMRFNTKNTLSKHKKNKHK